MPWFTVVLALLLCLAVSAEPLRVVCLGDSITKAARSGVTTEQTYEFLLQQRLVQDGLEAEVINCGIGGERTDVALKRLDKVIAQRPRVMTVMYGTNDAAVDKGASKSRLPLADYEANLRLIVARLREASIQPVLMTPIPLGQKFAYMEWSPYREQGPNCAMHAYVLAVRKVAREEAVPLVDNFAVWSELSFMGTDLDSLMLDGCHPNPQGQALLAETIYPVVAPLLRQ